MEKYVQSSTWGPDTGIIKNNKQGWKKNAAVKSKYRVTIEDILSDLYQTFALLYYQCGFTAFSPFLTASVQL